jgi:hypothetical protein
MKRHLIIGRLGPGDRVAIPPGTDETATPVDLVASEKQLGHGIGTALADLAKLRVFPTELGLDLLILAALVNAADTRISRQSESQDTWTREIRLAVPVSDPVRWNAASGILQRMLNFLTGDKWTLGFRARPTRASHQTAADEHEAGKRTGRLLEQIPARSHDVRSALHPVDPAADGAAAGVPPGCPCFGLSDATENDTPEWTLRCNRLHPPLVFLRSMVHRYFKMVKRDGQSLKSRSQSSTPP